MNYQSAKIYKLQHTNGNFYIASTTQTLHTRLAQHICRAKMCAKRKIPKFIMEDWDSWENVQLVLIEDFSCNSRNELRRKERGHIEKELNNPLCRNVPFIILKIKDYKKARRERLRSAILP